ncbi:Protein hold'em [Folsomia candida]|uniref:Protein hold'em n=1 Tax=Folsomia candida TaxID=158441 RepID=A0A226D343_FOLCA|nr:Protein hold'em [Folsomia candida]
MSRIYLITRYDWDNLTAHITRHTPRNVILCSTLQALEFFFPLQNRILQGKYECFVIYDIALNEGYFAIADTMLRVEIGQSIKGLEMGGFQNLWRRHEKHLNKVRAIKWPPLKVASPYISWNTLSPFFNAMGIIMILVGVGFLGEILSNEQLRERLRVKVVYSAAIVQISVRVVFSKLCKRFRTKKRRRRPRRKNYVTK